MTRRKFTPKFKTKVVLEALKERQTVKELAQRYEISPQQINLWKREFLSQAESVFEKGEKSGKSEAEEKEDRLLKVIGQQKVELDFLKNALR
ncbi:transposase [Leeuwenhoekiella parthenopeia]|uniref:Transposase n=1 Tax=Leeuwenhoekiella parthenopeia TaxID=2890320 RepID=A0ABS8GYM8_9FLAO|nr:transposase [Leeuwenhoekiella parthenopeia]MCC4214780.1 transposase [Leeuwenhoekiella parthenopeia]|tara:strand:+ start:58 stop:333 length:276 start_codon:yes stop_codon:yes gene_type:complete